MQALLIDSNARAEFERLVKNAEATPYNEHMMLERIAGRMPIPGTMPEHVAVIPVNLRIVLTHEEHPSGWMRFASFSVDGEQPSPIMVGMVLGFLGFTRPLEECMVDHKGSEHWVSVIEPLDDAAVILKKPLKLNNEHASDGPLVEWLANDLAIELGDARRLFDGMDGPARTKMLGRYAASQPKPPTDTDTQTASNVAKPPIRVKHADLERFGDSAHKSQCPSCGPGILTMQRSVKTMKLLKTDYCLNCGQRFVYTDIPNKNVR